MKITVTRLGSSDPATFAADFPARLQKVATHLARAIGLKALQAVKVNVPNRGGWYSIYRQALGAFENAAGTEVAVAGYATIPLPVAPAETSLLDFDNSTPISRVLSPYNPWVLDAILPIQGGYDNDVSVRAAGASAVTAERARLQPLLPMIAQQLAEAGATVLPDTAQVEIRGNLYTDIVWLAKRLESGDGGFPRVPHWRPAATLVEKSGVKWGQTEADAVEQLLRGHDVGAQLPVVSDQTMREFADKREGVA